MHFLVLLLAAIGLKSVMSGLLVMLAALLWPVIMPPDGGPAQFRRLLPWHWKEIGQDTPRGPRQ